MTLGAGAAPLVGVGQGLTLVLQGSQEGDGCLTVAVSPLRRPRFSCRIPVLDLWDVLALAQMLNSSSSMVLLELWGSST